MIGSFWNLCRACPSMPVDKLHSEYRSTYRWHEYTGPKQEVVRRPPQANPAPISGEKPSEIQSSKPQEEDVHNELPKLEPAMPRRKKYPDLAYRHHEFLTNEGEFVNGFCNNVESNRARSEERGPHWRPSRRSKSEGPRCGTHGEDMRERERRRESDPDLDNMGRETGLLRKAISKISTEYRFQFAWPPGHTSRRDTVDSSVPRKSQSMGALKSNANSIVHKKRIDLAANKDVSELEPLVDEKNNREDKNHIYKDDFNGESEYRKKFRPFSQYEYTEGRFTKRLNEDYLENNQNILPPNFDKNDSWYGEVVELRKKAGEYKHRGWGSELAPDRLSDINNKQVELWDQVSRRSTLSALSLASMTHKSYTKEEKEEDNNNKTSPSKTSRNLENSTRLVRDMVRHHLERTTGGSELDGLILSPTREKLEPTIPRKDDDSRGSQKNSPKKSSPLKSSSLKRNQKSKGTKNLRSQSVGPTDISIEKRSPKRQSRSATVKEKKTSENSKRPRPSSLNTTASTRSKSSSVPSKKEDNRLAKANSKNYDFSKQKLGFKLKNGIIEAEPSKAELIETVGEKMKDTAVEERPEIIDYEPMVKSPPEPTRVKSPEQILVRSPDPVNWTVPLDTGKTFTVTQNVREGDLGSRPHSEIKAWTPPEIPPPVAQSAPPTLIDQSKEKGMGFSSESMNSGQGRVIAAQLRDLQSMVEHL